MIYKGPLKKRGGGQGDSGELLVFLFDHAFLMVKHKSKPEQHKVYRRVSFLLYPFPQAPFTPVLAANSTRAIVDLDIE